MSAVRTEHRHHTDEQIREALEFARDLVAELDLPGPLEALAFKSAIDLRCAKQIELVQAAAGIPNMAIPRGR